MKIEIEAPLPVMILAAIGAGALLSCLRVKMTPAQIAAVRDRLNAIQKAAKEKKP